MFLSSITKTVSSRLGAKSILAVVLLITAISAILTSFFVARQKRLLTSELRTRVRSIARNLAYNSRDYIISGNTEKLYPLAKGVQLEKDIERAQIIDCDRKVIAHNDFGIIGKEFIFPVDMDSLSEKTWFPTEAEYIERMIIPVEIKRRPVHRNSVILYSARGNTIGQDSTIYLHDYLIFPCFTHDSKEVTFSSLNVDHSIKMIVSINITNLAHRVLVDEGSHGRWNHDGRYFAFVTEEKLAVYNMVTHELRIICDEGIGRAGFPCFTHDDAYIITTLQTNPPDIFSEKLFRIPLEGGEPEQLTFHDGQHWYPSCSPDGKWIVYTDLVDHFLYVYNIETGKSSRLFPGWSRKHNCGSFSPDGSKICYLLEINGNDEVFITEFTIDRKEQTYGTQLTSNGTYKWFPTVWSPDGKWITYWQDFNICIIPTGGGNPINLTKSLLNREILGYIVLDISLESMNSAVAEGTRFALLITIIIIGFGALSAVILVRKVVRPVQHIADATKEVARGNFNHTVPVTRNDEIGVLAESFNIMTGQLRNYREEIEAWNRELETKVTVRTAELAEKHKELESAYKELQTLDKAKDDFLSLVSHELRTPLGSMLLHAEMLLNKLIVSEDKQSMYHANIVEDCKRLTRLVNDVLDLSKIEAGRMPFTFDALPLRELLSDIFSSVRPILESKHLEFDYESVPGDIYLLGDRDKILQVLTNILSNAVKFSPESGAISVSLTSDGETGTIAVKDSGTGIRKEDIPKVFDRFSQLENIEHHSEGSGLGMTISKSIIERHNGTMWIESELGKGTTVFFTLPLAEKRPEPVIDRGSGFMQDGENSEKSGRNHEQNTVLIVDDEKSYRQAISDCVQSAGFESLEAADGYEALRFVKREHPALIILDVMMQGLSGLDVCRNLKNNPETSRIKIIMLSARGQEREKKEGLDAGADRYMTKPFDYKELIAVIEELLGE